MSSLRRFISLSVVALLALPLTAHAQIRLINGTSSGTISFGTQNVNGVNAQGAPVFTNERVFGGKNYGYLVGPRGPAANGGFQDRAGGFNQVAGVGPAGLPLTLVSGVNGQFGGGSVTAFSNNNGAWFTNLSLQDVPNNPPNIASVALATDSASFIVGPAGFNGTVGSFFAIGGKMPNPDPNAFLAASLTTVIDVFNPNPQLNQSFFARTWLGYKSGNNGFIDADGVNSPFANGNPAGGQPVVQKQMNFGTFGANSFSSGASITTLANFVAGTSFTVTNYLTMIANIAPGANNNANVIVPLNPGQVPAGITPPAFGASSAAAPEPGSILLALCGGACFLPRLRRRRVAA